MEEVGGLFCFLWMFSLGPGTVTKGLKLVCGTLTDPQARVVPRTAEMYLFASCPSPTVLLTNTQGHLD